MKCLVSIFFLILSVYTAAGQNGNEWIKYQQPYFKIPVAKDGIYKITQDALRQAGLPNSADPKTFQLFHRGIEQSILVAGENDGVFNTTDHIEFYGRANDGTLDASLYEIHDHQPHKYYNLYSDTTAYFLTFGGTASAKRITSYSGDSGGLAEETHHLAEKLLVLKESYSPGMDYGSIQKTTFDVGEGWTGLQILQGQERSYTIEQISETSPVSGKPVLEVLLTGRGPMLHDVELYAGSRFLATVSFPAYESFKHVQEIEWTDIDATGKLVIRIRVTGASGADRVSAGYIRLQFPQTFNIMGAPQKTFFLNPNPSDNSLLKILNPSVGLRLFDVTDPTSVLQIAGQLTTTLDAVVPSTSMQRKILATSESIPAAGIRKVTFREINPAGHNYIFITHRLLRKPAMGYIDPVKAFAEYRALPEGGGFDTLIMNIDQLYDQFNYGEASPRAVYQFMKFFASVKLPDYLFLVGKGLDV
ncbi:MAG TPA: C25 family cysteine peptidase, partial [Chryseosolibacter sp.]